MWPLSSLLPFVRAPARRVVRAVFGPPPIDPALAPGDAGLHGPGSASWTIIGSPAGIVGGIRALMVQLLHPGAMAGVADHSGYEDDPLERLRSTARYVATMTFGSMPEVFEVTRRVRHGHTFVRGIRPDGLPYSAEDPHLLAWVSIALTDSFLATHRAYAGDIDASTADGFVAEQSRSAALLDPRVDVEAIASDADAHEALRRGVLPLPMIEEGTLPTTEGELVEAMCRYRLELCVNEQSSGTFRFLLWPNIPPPVLAGYLPLMAGAAVTLPPYMRRLLNLPRLGATDAAVRAQARLAVRALRVLAGRSSALEIARRRVEDTVAAG